MTRAARRDGPPPKRAGAAPDAAPDAPPEAAPEAAPVSATVSATVAARLFALERVTEERWRRLERTLGRFEAAIDRMDRRLWIAAGACAAAGASAVGALLWRALGL